MPTGPAKSILWVANETQQLQKAIDIARSNSIHIIACHDAEAAKAILLQYTIGLAVVDCHLSTRNPLYGVFLIRHISRHFPDTRIVAKTKKASANIDTLLKETGAGDVVFHSLTQQDLVHMLGDDRSYTVNPEGRCKGKGDYIQPLENFLANEHIQAFLQPIVDIHQSPDKTFSYHGLEALARPPKHLSFWNPTFLFAYANLQERFLAADMKCIEAALQAASCLPADKTRKLFINLQPRSLIAPEFTTLLFQLVKRFAIHPTNIVLELTEQQAFLNPDTIIKTLEGLQQQGLQVALDDFGDGFSNLQFVQAINPDYLKLSGAFCRNLDRDHHKQVIVQTVVHMCKELGIRTIIEHVETREELLRARQLGVQYAQGYLFAKPLPAQQLLRQLPAVPLPC